jgi:carbon-monoxide dehydrogenase large subunit
VGRSLPRPHDVDLVRGLGRYVGDVRAPGVLDAHFVRSPLAHGLILEVDVRAALAVPGVVAAYSGADLADLGDVAPAPRSAQPDGMRRPVLARDRVRFAGEPVAVVLAETRYAAEDGGGEVVVDIDPLPVVRTVAHATAPDAPQLFDALSNVASERELDGAADGAPSTDLDEIVAGAAVVSTTVAHSQRLSPMSLEPRAVLAVPDDDGGLHVWCSHQAPHRLRAGLARALDLAPSSVRVTAPDVGGAFGAKSQTFAEYVVVAALARRHRRPVRWLEDRREALTAATHGRSQTLTVRLAADAEGAILALDAALDADVGAYPDHGDFIPEMTAWVMSGAYRITRVRVRRRTVVTNAAPVASYRGAGRPEAAYAVERAVDDLARLLGVDPVALRRRNLVPDEAFPYRSATGACYDSGRYGSALALATDLAGYDGWRAEQRRRRATGEGPLLGIGVATWVERSGGESGSDEYAAVEVGADGTVIGRVGTSPQGQGHEITFAQVLADAVGVEVGEVRMDLGDTARVPRGTGAFGSRSMQVGGTALHRAGEAVRVAARSRAAGLLGIAERDVVLGVDGFGAPGGGSVVSLADVAAAAAADGAPLAAEEVAAPPQAFPFGSYVCVVEVDPQTAVVTVVRLVAVDDCGVMVNPAVVEGQVVGSIAQGLGQALYEEMRYDADGQPQASTLLDYHVPTSAEMPDLVLGRHVTPNPHVPLGTKGAGESGCIGTPPAVLNAVRDALHGVDTSALHLPLTPAAVWPFLPRPQPPPSPRAPRPHPR